MVKFQKRNFFETLEDNDTNSGHRHNAHMYSGCLQKRLFYESTLPRFEFLTKPIHKCNQHRQYYVTKYQDIFVQYRECFNFVTGESSTEFKDVHLTIPEGAPSLTSYTKRYIRDGFVIPEESPVYQKLEKIELFRKQNWFGAIHTNVQINAKLDFMISRVLLEMDDTSLSICRKLWDLDRDLKHTDFILLTQKFPLVGYAITGHRHTFATLKSTNLV